MKGHLATTGKPLSLWLAAVFAFCAGLEPASRAHAQGTFEQELMTLARQSERFGKLEEAEKLCRQILTTDPMNQYAHHRLGVITASRGALDQAIAHFGAAERGGPPSPQLLNDFGGVLYLQGNLNTAEQKLRAALTLDPANQEAARNLELVLVKQQALTAAAAEERLAAESQAARHNQAAAQALAAAHAAARAREIAEARAALEGQAASQAIADARMASLLRTVAEAKMRADRPTAPSQLDELPRPVAGSTPAVNPPLPLPVAPVSSFRLTDIPVASTPLGSTAPKTSPAVASPAVAKAIPDAAEDAPRRDEQTQESARPWGRVITRLKTLFGSE